MKANRHATARTKTFVDHEPEEFDSHITSFRGIRTGVAIALILFWLPFFAILYFFSWLHLIAYGLLLMTMFAALGLVCRHFDPARSHIPSTEAVVS